MQRDGHESWLFAVLGGLGVWLTLTAGALTWLNPDTATLSCALLALTAVVTMTDLFPYAEWAMAGISLVLHASLQVSLWGFTPNALMNAGIGAMGLVGTALLSSVAARRVLAVVRQVERDRKLINELTVHDPRTGLMKEQYACQALHSEIDRGRRYRSDLSLLLMRVANWDELVQEHGASGADALMGEAARTVMDTLRTVDIPFTLDGGALGAILLEVSAEGARVAAQRLLDAVARKVRVGMRVGVAYFPGDAVTSEGLLRAAEAALRFALTSGRPIVCYGQLYLGAETRMEDFDQEMGVQMDGDQTAPHQMAQETSITVGPEILLKQ
jgi:diguanylate cyclase (GGDEF)-like protein